MLGVDMLHHALARLHGGELERKAGGEGEAERWTERWREKKLLTGNKTMKEKNGKRLHKK